MYKLRSRWEGSGPSPTSWVAHGLFVGVSTVGARDMKEREREALPTADLMSSPRQGDSHNLLASFCVCLLQTELSAISRDE